MVTYLPFSMFIFHINVLQQFVSEVFSPYLSIQVTMIRARSRSFNMEEMIVLFLSAVFIAASMKKEHIGGLRIFAEAGRIEEPPLRERENAGILHGIHKYMDFRQTLIFVSLSK